MIFNCLAIKLSPISASGMEHVHGCMQTVEDYSNTTVNSLPSPGAKRLAILLFQFQWGVHLPEVVS